MAMQPLFSDKDARVIALAQEIAAFVRSKAESQGEGGDALDMAVILCRPYYEDDKH